jgi:hypothetical protein
VQNNGDMGEVLVGDVLFRRYVVLFDLTMPHQVALGFGLRNRSYTLGTSHAVVTKHAVAKVSTDSQGFPSNYPGPPLATDIVSIQNKHNTQYALLLPHLHVFHLHHYHHHNFLSHSCFQPNSIVTCSQVLHQRVDRIAAAALQSDFRHRLIRIWCVQPMRPRRCRQFFRERVHVWCQIAGCVAYAEQRLGPFLGHAVHFDCCGMPRCFAFAFLFRCCNKSCPKQIGVFLLAEYRGHRGTDGYSALEIA